MAAQSPPASISSPCIGVCTLHPDGYCIGCFRSSEEIQHWAAMPESRRQAIMSELERRCDDWMFREERTAAAEN